MKLQQSAAPTIPSYHVSFLVPEVRKTRGVRRRAQAQSFKEAGTQIVETVEKKEIQCSVTRSLKNGRIYANTLEVQESNRCRRISQLVPNLFF